MCRSLPCRQYPSEILSSDAQKRPERAGAPAKLPLLKGYLQSELDESWIPRSLHAPEVRPVGGVAVWLRKLRVIESVEKIRSELQFKPFADGRYFHNGEVPVVNSRPAANGPRGVTDGARRHSVFGERVRIESGIN